MASPPTVAEIRERSRLDWDADGYGEDAALQTIVDQAVNWLAYMTARRYPDAQTDAYPEVKSTMDVVVMMRAEQMALMLRADQLETVADFDLIGSFSAGLYSETRRNLDMAKGTARPLNPWPALNDLLWLLLGLFPGEVNDAVSDRYDYWFGILTGQNPPAWAAIEVDWGRGMGLEPWPGSLLWPDPAGVWDSRIG
jgi:hypothetical protein